MPDGFTPLFNDRDFTGWKVPAGDNGHWRIVDRVIDYDAEGEAKEKDLWTGALSRFTLRVDWRIVFDDAIAPRPLTGATCVHLGRRASSIMSPLTPLVYGNDSGLRTAPRSASTGNGPRRRASRGQSRGAGSLWLESGHPSG